VIKQYNDRSVCVHAHCFVQKLRIVASLNLPFRFCSVQLSSNAPVRHKLLIHFFEFV